jgi:hypothetical protein
VTWRSSGWWRRLAMTSRSFWGQRQRGDPKLGEGEWFGKIPDIVLLAN